MIKRSLWFLPVLLALLLAACGGGNESPTATPVPDAWERIQSEGRMVVGTSADYEPFEYYDANFKLDGFDIALMNAIGKELGLQIDFKDYAFDGLGDALSLGRIDTAIAAISVTPERENVVDFSSVYYVSEDAFLASNDSTLTGLQELKDVSKLRVGVEEGSIYQEWMEDTVIASGDFPQRNLQVYKDINDAVRDLSNGRVDVVIMDLPVAESYVKSGTGKIVAQGLNKQLFAIALPQGQRTLQAQINKALSTLQSNGTVATLLKQYLNLDANEVVDPPTPTPEPPTPTPGPATATPSPATPTVAPACVNDMSYVDDVTYDDNNMKNPPILQPGQPFIKTWRIKNSGTCQWDSSYIFKYVSGNVAGAQMGGQPTPVQGTVQPGQNYDISVNLVAPVVPGVYQAFWQMYAPSGKAFGQRVYVGIQVPAPATPTPAPTATPNASIKFTVNQTSIQAGQCVTFSWQVQNVQAVYFYPDGANWQNYGVAGTGQQTECPTQTTTYNLRVVQNNGAVVVQQITITVTPAPNAPTISQFVIQPQGQITAGQCVAIQWQVQGNVSKVQLYRGNTSLWDGAPVQGSYQDCPPGTGTVTYVLNASGSGGTSQAQQTINVVSPATATPAPTPPPADPVILAYNVTPTQIQTGQCVQITWSVGGGASGVDLQRNGGIILDNGALSGTTQDCPPGAGSFVYRLEAYNAAGKTTVQDVTVTVNEAPPSNPLANTQWNVLQYWDGSALVDPIPGTVLTTGFTAGGQVNGFSGCNDYSGSYVVQGQSLAITGLSSGRLACSDPAGVMQQETAFMSMLQQTVRYAISGGQMAIYNASGQKLAQYQKAS